MSSNEGVKLAVGEWWVNREGRQYKVHSFDDMGRYFVLSNCGHGYRVTNNGRYVGSDVDEHPRDLVHFSDHQGPVTQLEQRATSQAGIPGEGDPTELLAARARMRPGRIVEVAPGEHVSGGGKLKGDHYYRVEVAQPISPEVQPYIAECADIIEALDMTFNEGEAFKALWRLAAARQGRGKPGNKPEYDADKAAHYGQRTAVHTRRMLNGE